MPNEELASKLGQAAYLGYWDDYPIEPFSSLSVSERRAWESAATAILQLCLRGLYETIDKFSDAIQGA